MNPGRELDALVAEKVMGWEDVGLASEIELYNVYEGLRPDGKFGAVPEYSTDISAAWEVVTKLCSSFYLSYDDSDCSWQVRLDQKRCVAEDCRGQGYADTAPHAICLAALKAVGVEI